MRRPPDPRKKARNGCQVRSEAPAPAVGSGRRSPTIDSASSREDFELATSRAPSRYQQARSARPCSSALVTKVMSTISFRSPITGEAVRQAPSSRRAPSWFRSPQVQTGRQLVHRAVETRAPGSSYESCRMQRTRMPLDVLRKTARNYCSSERDRRRAAWLPGSCQAFGTLAMGRFNRLRVAVRSEGVIR